MRRAKIGADEGARLGAVRDYDPGDLAADPALQEIATIAARRFDAPIALITLVRESEQIFLARTGIDRSGTDRDISFCSHALGSDDLLVVPDATLDPRFAGNPLVVGPPYVRFYAGVPLRVPSGHVLGTLCVVDPQPRNGLSARDRQALRALGAQALGQLEALRLERAHAEGPHRFRQLAVQSSDAIVSTDAQGRITFWNDAAERLLGMDASQALGRALADFLPAIEGPAASRDKPFHPGRHVPVGEPFDSDARRKDGALLPVSLSLLSTGRDAGAGYDVVLRDGAARHRADDLAYRAASQDALTGLPSLAVLIDRLEGHTARGDEVHLLRLGLTDLPEPNAADPGHVRDLVLKEVAGRVVDSVRHGDTVTRLGTEFVVLRVATPGEPQSAALIVADRILGSLIAPAEAGEQPVRLGAHIGIACFPKHADTPDALMEAAAGALQQARREGRRTRRVHGEAMRRDPAENDGLHEPLVQALARGEFELFYQPQVDLGTGDLVGAEALIRWNHPQRGLLTPADFLGTIDNSPLAVPVGTWVLEAACSQAVVWRQRHSTFRMGVNLFGAQLHSRGFAEEVLAILDRTGLPASGLELEITEKVMLDRSTEELGALSALHAQGVGIAFDDFGTGYASLCMLKDTPLTRLKVDRSFVKDIAEGGPDAMIVAAVATLGTGLGLDVLAEGIEDEAQWTLLRASGCRTGQGYWIGHPMRAADFDAWMHDRAVGRTAGVRT
ncbi:EAL domain-containing protein [Sphingomonas sp. PL-96]|uniref:putative bifunctional diguanylate cyclase/phosphodiesterase n=1 Tax=Sphingomonas sp. PL-96 TaxID=2887201 RepID=UPI001E4D699E|nr:EAL domain-containing protein [Sphingomonas sp. PL-96]MCC2976774.1 EAL domain-containing protein [Sphingomonas sp. PL-96]